MGRHVSGDEVVGGARIYKGAELERGHDDGEMHCRAGGNNRDGMEGDVDALHGVIGDCCFLVDLQQVDVAHGALLEMFAREFGGAVEAEAFFSAAGHLLQREA